MSVSLNQLGRRHDLRDHFFFADGHDVNPVTDLFLFPSMVSAMVSKEDSCSIMTAAYLPMWKLRKPPSTQLARKCREPDGR
jgi:hypothetical protein